MSIKQENLRKILILDLKNRGYHWETVNGRGGESVSLSDAPLSQLRKVRDDLIRKNKRKIARDIQDSLQLKFDF